MHLVVRNAIVYDRLAARGAGDAVVVCTTLIPNARLPRSSSEWHRSGRLLYTAKSLRSPRNFECVVHARSLLVTLLPATAEHQPACPSFWRGECRVVAVRGHRHVEVTTRARVNSRLSLSTDQTGHVTMLRRLREVHNLIFDVFRLHMSDVLHPLAQGVIVLAMLQGFPNLPPEVLWKFSIKTCSCL